MVEDVVIDLGSSLKKSQYLLLILPLITFIILEVNIIITLVYTVLLALHLLYIHTLVSFGRETTKDVLGIRREVGLSHWYIPSKGLFIGITIINLITFMYSFYLSVRSFDHDSSFTTYLLIAHVFVTSLVMCTFFFVNYFKNIVTEKKN